MKHKQLTTALLTIILSINLVFGYFIFLDKPQVVYVDSNALLENYEGMKAARLEFQQKALKWQANIDTLRAELTRVLEEHQAAQSTMTKKELALSEALIETKKQQLIDYQQGIQQKSQQEDAQMTERVLSEVNVFIEDYGKKKGYTIILGATTLGNIVYAAQKLNITEELQAALNANYLAI